MGRRKIEIQPITHERNRSVTFLKRKNGLFKKAYELGVLCSVDVAVIIFEARPGHEVKLHEYSSSDIRNIIQRQTRHQGDTDLKVPADFSGSAAKFDDAGDAEGDDDIGDEEEDLPATKPSNRRRGRGRLTLTSSVDAYSAQLPPPPPPAHHLHPESGAAALLSVANDRVSNMRDLHPSRPNKRTRNARSRSPSGDPMIPALPAMNSEWSLSQDNHGIARYGRNIRPPPPSGLSQQQQQDHQHPQQYHSMHPHQQQHPGHGFQYTPLFPVSNQVSPPPAFIPLHHQEFGSARGLPGFGNRPGGSGSGPEGGSGYADLHQRMRPSESPGYDPAPYPPNANPMTRHSEHHHHHHHQQTLLSQPPPTPPAFHAQPPAAAGAPQRREDRGADGLFGNLLEADERSRQRGSGPVTGGAGAGLDWPMHDGLAPQERSGPTAAGGVPRSSVEGPGSNGSDWFDFLSRSNAINEVQGSSGRRSSASTWPKNGDNNMDARHNNNKTGDDVGGLYDGRKESAVRGGQGGGGGGGGGEVEADIPIPSSPEDGMGEEDSGKIDNEDASGDADDTGV